MLLPGSASNLGLRASSPTCYISAAGRQTGSCAVCVTGSGRLSVQLPQRQRTYQICRPVVEVAHEDALLRGVSNGAPQDVFRRARAHDFELWRAAPFLGRMQRQQPSVPEHPLQLHISECRDRTSDRFMRCLSDVLWEALRPAAATPEDSPDLPPSLQGMDSTLHPFHRSSRSLDHSEMDRSPEALAESALDVARAERSETLQRHSEDAETPKEREVQSGHFTGTDDHA